MIKSFFKLAKYIPSLDFLYNLNWFNQGDMLQKILEEAKNITKKEKEEEAVDALIKNEKMLMALQNRIIELSAQAMILQDKHSARLRDMHIHKSSQDNVRANFMVISAILGILSCLGILCFYKNSLSPELTTMISTISGIFGACLKDAYSFEFGSSRGSKEKYADLIAHKSKKL